MLSPLPALAAFWTRASGRSDVGGEGQVGATERYGMQLKDLRPTHPDAMELQSSKLEASLELVDPACRRNQRGLPLEVPSPASAAMPTACAHHSRSRGAPRFRAPTR